MQFGETDFQRVFSYVTLNNFSISLLNALT